MNAALIPLNQSTIARLLDLRATADEPLENVIARLMEHKLPLAQRVEPTRAAADERCAIRAQEKYAVDVLGQRLEADSLSSLFASVIDLIAELDPAVLDRLSQMASRKRRYLSKAESDIHPDRPDLKTMRTKSGWWVSANVGKEDVARALKAVCLAARLEFGRDIVSRDLVPSVD